MPLAMANCAVLTRSGTIAIITLRHAPVNSLSKAVYLDVTRCVAQIATDETITGVVLCGTGRCFCAGADITEFGSGSKSDGGGPMDLAYGLELLNIPVVAAVHSWCLGGGFELSLMCHHRVAVATARFGLPEVNIGLLPGGQGTQRLPRLIGAEKALALMTTGRHITAEDALGLGLVERVFPGTTAADARGAGIVFLEQLADSGAPSKPRVSALPTPSALGVDFAKWHKKLARKRRGESAPAAIIRCVEAACDPSRSFTEGAKYERMEFKKLEASVESAALRHFFFAVRAAPKIIPRTSASTSASTSAALAKSTTAMQTTTTTITCVGIVGAGLMGGGIAMCCAKVGIRVLLLDTNRAGLDRGLATIDANFARSVKRGSTSRASAMHARALIIGTLEISSLRECDLVVEAVFEDMSVKKQIFAELDRVCKPDAILCSNTSALDIDEIATAVCATRRPRMMGAHFFSPANVMKLLENVRGKWTSDATVAALMQWGRRIGKTAILVGNCPGFVGNRMIAVYGAHARAMLEEGATPLQIDSAATEVFGMRMGPFQMSDLVGLDLGLGAAKKRGEYAPDTIVQHALVGAGRCGQKTRAGWYDYSYAKGGGQRTAQSSAKVAQIIARVIETKRERAGASSWTRNGGRLDARAIIERLFFPMINEGFRILADGIAQRPSDIDVCYCLGYAFPKTRGGPMFYADTVGLPAIARGLRGMGIEVAPLLAECVREGATLAEHWEAREERRKQRAQVVAASSKL